MAHGKSAPIIMPIVGLLAMSMFIVIADANSFTVGDSRGWTFDVSSWPNGKSFVAGDTLVFKYSSQMHNVVQVSKEGYDACQVIPGNAPKFQSGNDQIKLQNGDNYFICSFTGHCQDGMKIAVHAN